MFTGIIKSLGKVVQIETQGNNKRFRIQSDISKELSIDESVAHNGVCLTIVEKDDTTHIIDVIEESLLKSNLNQLMVGNSVNLERALVFGGRLDGHLVQGHVDGIATCTNIEDKNGSKEFTFLFNTAFASLVIEKGSVCLNGVSLTCFSVTKNSFKVAIIPYTYEHTTFGLLDKGDTVNIEFDLLGKYIIRHQSLR